MSMNTRGVSEAMTESLETLRRMSEGWLHPDTAVLKWMYETFKAALSAPEPAAQGEAMAPFIVGNAYRTLAGDLVRFVSVHNEGTSYETMADEDGVHRYTRRDFGRVTGTAHDYSDPRNTPPLYTAPPAQPAEQGEAVYYEKRDWHHDGGWHRIDKATFEQYENYHKRFGGKSPVRALGVIAPPAQPAERVPDAMPYPKLGPEQEACDGYVHECGFADGWNACRAAMLAASPAPSEGVKGADDDPPTCPICDRMKLSARCSACGYEDEPSTGAAR